MVNWSRQLLRAAPEDRGEVIVERHEPREIRASGRRAAVIAEAARRVARANPKLHAETIAQERGYLSALLFEELAEMVLEGRPRVR